MKKLNYLILSCLLIFGITSCSDSFTNIGTPSIGGNPETPNSKAYFTATPVEEGIQITFTDEFLNAHNNGLISLRKYTNTVNNQEWCEFYFTKDKLQNKGFIDYFVDKDKNYIYSDYYSYVTVTASKGGEGELNLTSPTPSYESYKDGVMHFNGDFIYNQESKDKFKGCHKYTCIVYDPLWGGLNDTTNTIDYNRPIERYPDSYNKNLNLRRFEMNYHVNGIQYRKAIEGPKIKNYVSNLPASIIIEN